MILVTGASGLVGNAIFGLLHERKMPVIGLCHSREMDNLFCLDLESYDDVTAFFGDNQIDCVIHCAARIPSGGSLNDIDIYQANMFMLENILYQIPETTPFVYLSGTAIYNLTGDNRIAEDGDTDCNSSYLLSKKHGEDLIKLFFKKTGNYLILRISSPYSIRKKSNSVLYRFIDSAIQHRTIRLWGSGERRQAFTNVSILASGVLDLFDRNITGVYNFVTNQSTSMTELAIKIQKVVPGTEIFYTKKEDPEEKCRTSISNDKIQQFFPIIDHLDQDIESIIERFPK